MSRRSADLPLHGGSAPAWLFRRMTDLAGAIGSLIVRDQGPQELLRRLSDPFWFQAFGCVLGFDWHSSGVTTTVCGALKQAARKYGQDLGIVVCGGKGATSRKTPDDIRRACDKSGDDGALLVRASKLAAKVDSAAVQDGFQLYHHAFFFVPGGGDWSVVQQGMSEVSRYARRYHWLSESMSSFVKEPHAAVACDTKTKTLNLVAGESDPHRQALVELSREKPERVLRELGAGRDDAPMPLFESGLMAAKEGTRPELTLPARHSITIGDLKRTSLRKVLLTSYERQATTFEELLGETGVGPMALRSLSLIAELIYNAPASRRDPAAYSFAHGGKDGHPYFVNRAVYDANLERLRHAIDRARIGRSAKVEALKSLARFIGQASRLP